MLSKSGPLGTQVDGDIDADMDHGAPTPQQALPVPHAPATQPLPDNDVVDDNANDVNDTSADWHGWSWRGWGDYSGSGWHWQEDGSSGGAGEPWTSGARASSAGAESPAGGGLWQSRHGTKWQAKKLQRAIAHHEKMKGEKSSNVKIEHGTCYTVSQCRKHQSRSSATACVETWFVGL